MNETMKLAMVIPARDESSTASFMGFCKYNVANLLAFDKIRGISRIAFQIFQRSMPPETP